MLTKPVVGFNFGWAEGKGAASRGFRLPSFLLKTATRYYPRGLPAHARVWEIRHEPVSVLEKETTMLKRGLA